MKLVELLEEEKNKYIDLINDNATAISFLKNNNIQEIMNSPDLSAKLAGYILDSYDSNDSHFFSINMSLLTKKRIQHTVAIWLMGLGINSRLNLYKKGFFNDERLWTLTSIGHDYGYFSDEIKDGETTIEELTKNYNLLTNTYDKEFLYCLNGIDTSEMFKKYFTYDYDILNKYFNYSKYLHEIYPDEKDNEIIEKCDHGIVGGCKLFEQICKNIEPKKKKTRKFGYTMYSPSIIETQMTKIACINVAYHNIFKAKEENDEDYNNFKLDILSSKKNPTIDGENDLLLLLSLIDTVECYKRFSKKKGEPSLENKTIINYIYLDFINDYLVIDFNHLSENIAASSRSTENKKKLINELDKHILGILELPNWTPFDIERDNFKVKIKFNKERSDKYISEKREKNNEQNSIH